MNVIRAEAVLQAERMLVVLDERRPGTIATLRGDAVSELSTWTDELQVVVVPDAQSDARCSVAGGYVHTTTPPTLTVASSTSRGRRQFTALHELGHHLQKNDVDLAVAVRSQLGDVETFEDTACDAFAARVLVTDDELNGMLGDRSPTAADLVSLFNGTQASRAAVCARVAERLGNHGFTAVLDDEGAVQFAIGKGDVIPPARGSDQSGTPLVASALARGVDVAVDSTFVQYRTGSKSRALYGDAAWCGDYLMVVAVVDRPGWKKFAPPRVEGGTFVSRRPWCDICQEEFVGDPCGSCRQPKCPRGHCACNTEQLCMTCFLKKHPVQMATATLCKECAG